MKRLISTQGLWYGEFKDENLITTVNERINKQLECSFKQEYGEEVHTTFNFNYNVMEGIVTQMVLDYTINKPTPKRLENFREHCDNYFELHKFIIDDIASEDPHIYFFACDTYDMACLIHAFRIMTVNLDNIMCAVDEKYSKEEAIYNPLGDLIIQIPDVPQYRILEGTMWISPGAFRNCKRLRQLDIPCSMIEYQNALNEYEGKLKYKVWKTHYDGTPNEEDEEIDDDEDYIIDDFGVGYTKDSKKLLFARYTFNKPIYEVPDGVEEIEGAAFIACKHYMELSLPRSVKVIGDCLFGSAGGIIVFRD